MKALLEQLKNSKRGQPPRAAPSGAATAEPRAAPAGTRDSTAAADCDSRTRKRQRVEAELPIVNVVFHCLEGSVTHYYHFFFGAMVPLIFHSLDNGASNVYRICTDIGPMKRIIGELPLNVLEYEGPNLSMGAKFHDDKSLGHAVKPGETVLPAYDAYNTEIYTDEYVKLLSKSQLRRVGQFFSDNLPNYIRSIPVYDVILIERGTESYYEKGCSNRTEIYKTSGAERRRILNHEELVAALRAKYGDSFCNIVLERSSIYYQYHMFHNAKVVIAQHGAALANTIFMMNPPAGREKTGMVLEFSPPWSRQFQHFKNLAQACGVKHVSILQDADVGNVDVGAVMAALDAELLEQQGSSADVDTSA